MPPPFPWKFPYQPDSPRQREVLRPIVSVRLGGGEWSTPVFALADSGSEHILAAPWLPSDALIDVDTPKYETVLGIGGDRLPVRFADARMRLQHPDGDDDDYVEWEVEIGFPRTWRISWQILLGQVGFFDRFTVSMHRAARLTVVEEHDEFDKRFGIDPAPPATQPPRQF